MIAGLMLMCYAPSPVYAQETGHEVVGVVVDQTGTPVAGATVIEQGTTSGAYTDGQGRFSVRVRPGAVLEIAYLGYKTVTLPADSPALSLVTLEQDAMSIDDVIVVGYGTVRKDDMTGSVAVIRSEEINRGAVVSPQEMLKGKLPGVQIMPGSGDPSSGATIRIRGEASLKANNNPLIVIDGVPIANDAGQGMANPLQTVNPNDIETISVLKDASAAAIYGSRASNGVIIITTKKGTGNQVRFSYNGSMSVETNSGRINVMRPGEFRDFIDEVYPTGSSVAADRIQALVGPESTDWQKLIFRTAISNDHNASVYGNLNDRMPYRASLGYTNHRGTLETSLYERGTLDLSVAPNFFDKHLTVNLNAKGAATFQNNADGGAVGGAAFANPTVDPYFRNEDGSIDYTTANGFWSNGSGRGNQFMPNTLVGAGPLSLLYDRINYGHGKRVITNAQVDYKVHGFEALRFNLNLGLDWSSTKGTDGVRPNSFQAWADTEARGWGQYREWTNLRRNKLLEAYADFNKTWGRHHVDVMAGYSWQHFYSSDQNGISYFNETGEMKNTIANYPWNKQENYLVSFYGRANYSYDSRYLFTFTLRDDGSSRFAKNQRWGLFPSAAVAWNIANEAFMQDARAVSALKLRLGWGKTGQQEIFDNYPHLARYVLSTDIYHQYNMGSAGMVHYLTPSSYDPAIRWETTTTWNVGLDFGFLGGRITGSLEWYDRRTTDLLNEVTTAMGANFGNSLLTNIGSMKNTGVEFAVNVIPVATEDWNLEVGFNGTFQSTEFTKFSNTTAIGSDAINVSNISGGTGNTIARHAVGYAPYTFYAYQQVYDSKGHPIQNALVDRDEDGVITEADRYMTGKSPTPDFFYGLSVKLNYKQWDFGFNGHGSVGNWVYNNFASEHSSANIDVNAGNLPNLAKTVKTTGFRGTNSVPQVLSDLFLENASFFRMDDINLGYTFAKPFKWLGSVRLAFSVQNVFVITDYSGVDPEISFSNDRMGVDGQIWPRPRTYSLRLNVNF